MGCPSDVRRMHRSRPAWTPASIGDLPIPDPRTWPAGVRERFRELAGECGHLDVSIFSFGSTAVMYLQDAITALGILDVDPSGWHAKDGYPAFYFDAERVCEFSQRLAACGYAVRVLEPANPSGRIGARAARAEVIDIASARRRINAL